MPDTSLQPRRFPFLDELRGVAIVMDFTAEMFSLNRIRMEAGKASSAEE